MQISPSKDEFQQQIEQGFNVIPVWTEILADLETPVSCFIKVKEAHPEQAVFMLESVEGGEKIGRYSFIGLNPAGLLKVQNDKTNFQSFQEGLDLQLPQGQPFEALNELLNTFKSPVDKLPYSASGLVGALAYDTVRFIEPIPQLKVDSLHPEAAFVLVGDLIVFDNLTRTIRLITNVYLSPSKDSSESQYKEATEKLHKLKALLEGEIKPEHRKAIPTGALGSTERASDWSSSLSQPEFEQIVTHAQERIKAGDIFQIVLSQQMKVKKKNVDPLYIYRLLRSLNPSPYLFLLDFVDFQLVGSSPEVMVQSTVNPSTNERTALLRPIAGTYRRGKSAEEDLQLAEKLKNDPKELAEHLMLIDLARNDLGRVAVPGTVKLTDLMIVEKYSHVLHLVSEVVCKLKDNSNSVDLLKAVFPAGTLSGAPKVKAMQIIADLEPLARGFYGGCVGYIGYNGYVNTAMTIRTLLMDENEIRLQAGAGIVYDSDPSKEYQETINKAAALMKVVEQALDG